MLTLAESAELSPPLSGVRECSVGSLLSILNSERESRVASKLQYSGKNISPSSSLIFRTPTSICVAFFEASSLSLLCSTSSCEFCRDREPKGQGISRAWVKDGAVAMNSINEAGTSCSAARGNIYVFRGAPF